MNIRTKIACVIFSALIAPTVFAQTVTPAALPTGRALLISDIHLDPLAGLTDPANPATQAILRQLIAAPASGWAAILSTSPQTSFATYGSDANYPLLASALTAIAAQPPFDYVLFTGDALRHNFSPAFIAAGGTAADYPAFATSTEAFVIQQLQDRLKVPVLIALGNNDSACGDYQIPPASPFLTTIADQIAALAASPEARATFQLGGYYALPHPTVANHEIFVLNTIFWSASYKSCAAAVGDPGEAELDWLAFRLYSARLLHHSVTLVMHIPPGMDAYNSAHAASCRAPVAFWKPNYAERFGRLMTTYSDVVELAFAGHTHEDDFRVSTTGSPSLPLRITPSISPIFKNNPGFSVMTYSLTTGGVTDITTYYLPLSSPAAAWTEEYRLDAAYQVGSFSAPNLAAIAGAIRSGEGADRARFEQEYAVSAKSPIQPANLAYYSCAQTHLGAAGYSDCVCAFGP